MSITDTATENSHPPTWAHVAKIAIFWLIGCSAVGIIAATINGEFGSIIYVGVCVLVGLSGAIFHSVLARRPSFLRLSPVPKAAILWIGAMIIPMAWAILGALTSNVRTDMSYVVLFFGGIAAVALVASICITLYEGRWSV
jgi:hypothetical protein